jgi:hypothetical protein
VQRSWRRGTWRLFSTAATSKHFIGQVENKVEGLSWSKKGSNLVAWYGEDVSLLDPPRTPSAAQVAAQQCRLPLPLLFFSPTPSSFLLLHEQQRDDSRMGVMAPTARVLGAPRSQPPRRRSTLSPLFFFPPLLLFSSGG